MFAEDDGARRNVSAEVWSHQGRVATMENGIGLDRDARKSICSAVACPQEVVRFLAGADNEPKRISIPRRLGHRDNAGLAGIAGR